MKTHRFYQNKFSSYGNVNYSPFSQRLIDRHLHRLTLQYKDCIIINGSSDFNDPNENRPKSWINDFNLKTEALIHTGVSGLTESGIILSKSEFTLLETKYLETFGHAIKENKTLSFYEYKSFLIWLSKFFK